MPSYQVGGAELYFHATGDGSPAIVFVHGALCHHDDWRHQVGHFSARHRVLAPDLRGHGQSRGQPGPLGIEQFAADLLALLDEQDIGRAVLVGHSMGCRVLLQMAHDAPDRVAALVCVDGAYLVPRPMGAVDMQERVARADAARARASALFVGSEPAERLRVGFRKMFFDDRFAPERERVLAHAVSLPREVPRELMPGFAAWDVMNLERILATVRAPMLVFASTCMDGSNERRPLRPEDTTAWLEALALHAPHAEISRHYDAGHFLMLEQPAMLNERIDAFLTGLTEVR